MFKRWEILFTIFQTSLARVAYDKLQFWRSETGKEEDRVLYDSGEIPRGPEGQSDVKCRFEDKKGKEGFVVWIRYFNSITRQSSRFSEPITYLEDPR